MRKNASNNVNGEVKKDNSPKTYSTPKIDWELSLRVRPDLTEKQKALIELIKHKDTKMVFIKGSAGSTKTFCSIMAGLYLLNEKKVSDITYVRPIVESSESKLGFLPGNLSTDENSKLGPYAQVFFDLINEFLPINDVKKLKSEDRLKFIPVNFLRGQTCRGFMIIDEIQNYSIGEMRTITSRLSTFSKMVFCFDPSQSDLPSNKQGAAEKIFNLFKDNEEAQDFGVFCLEFSDEEILRSEICKYMVKMLKDIK